MCSFLNSNFLFSDIVNQVKSGKISSADLYKKAELLPNNDSVIWPVKQVVDLTYKSLQKYHFTYDEFKKTLKKCDLTIKKFANMCGLHFTTISTTWKSKNEVPKWVETWLNNYIKAKTLDNVKDVICPVKDNDE